MNLVDRPRAPATSNGDPTLVWIDVHTTSHKRCGQVVCKVEHEIWLLVSWEREPLQTSAACRGCLHLNPVIERLGKVARGGVLQTHQVKDAVQNRSSETHIGVVLSETLASRERDVT